MSRSRQRMGDPRASSPTLALLGPASDPHELAPLIGAPRTRRGPARVAPSHAGTFAHPAPRRAYRRSTERPASLAAFAIRSHEHSSHRKTIPTLPIDSHERWSVQRPHTPHFPGCFQRRCLLIAPPSLTVDPPSTSSPPAQGERLQLVAGEPSPLDLSPSLSARAVLERGSTPPHHRTGSTRAQTFSLRPLPSPRFACEANDLGTTTAVGTRCQGLRSNARSAHGLDSGKAVVGERPTRTSERSEHLSPCDLAHLLVALDMETTTPPDVRQHAVSYLPTTEFAR